MAQQQRKKLVAGAESAGGPVHVALPQITAQTRVWFNPDLKSVQFVVPGIIAVIMMMGSM